MQGFGKNRKKTPREGAHSGVKIKKNHCRCFNDWILNISHGFRNCHHHVHKIVQKFKIVIECLPYGRGDGIARRGNCANLGF